MVRADLAEIQNRLTALKKEFADTPKENEYKRKRILYFTNLNKDARTEFSDYLDKGIIKTLLDCKSYKLSSQKNDGLSMLFLNGRYKLHKKSNF